MFVNEVAEIVHATVDSFNGQSNKNIGEAFLLVWKFRKDDYSEGENGVLKLHYENNLRV